MLFKSDGKHLRIDISNDLYGCETIMEIELYEPKAIKVILGLTRYEMLKLLWMIVKALIK